MKFKCKKCEKTKDLYKVKFTSVDKNLICKDAVCCDEYMETVTTKEYEGMPEIKRNEEHCKSKNYIEGLTKGK
jgi:ssDNA-binding Zn-finger/Zn-ribbon topoisomerase 1